MTQSIRELESRVQQLRADLMATNLALHCTFSGLDPKMRESILKGFVELTTAQDGFAGAQVPQETQALLQQAMERQYKALQGAHLNRASREAKRQG